MRIIIVDRCIVSKEYKIIEFILKNNNDINNKTFVERDSLMPIKKKLMLLPDYIENDNIDGILSLFSGNIDIDFPLTGRITSNTLFRYVYKNNFIDWKNDFKAIFKIVNCITANKTIIMEIDLLHLSLKKKQIVTTPVALVCETNGEHVSVIRGYHSTSLIIGKSTIRKAIMDDFQDLVLPPIFQQYFDLLMEGKRAEKVPELFTPDGYFRGNTIYNCYGQGPEGIIDAFQKMFDAIDQEGELPEAMNWFRHCSCYEVGPYFATEWMLITRGINYVTPQSGFAIYKFADDGKIQWAHVYDDPVDDSDPQNIKDESESVE